MMGESASSPRAPHSSPAGGSLDSAAAYQPSTRAVAIALTGSAVAWTIHLLAGYVLLATYCSAGWSGGGVAIAALTVVCAAAAAATGVLSLRIYRRAQEGLRVDDEPGGPEAWDARLGERGARAVFLGVVGMFLAGIFTLAIVLQGLPALFAPFCPAWTMP
jgi:hypothetical protein